MLHLLGNGRWVLLIWAALLIYLFTPPRNPPSAPTGCGSVYGSAVAAYAMDEREPVFLSPPVSYADRFCPLSIGPDWAWAEVACEGCPIATAAVREQGVGE